MIVLKSPEEIDRMRKAGRIVAEVLDKIREMVEPGITTLELDRLAEAECAKRKVRPAFKGYGGFPFTICASPNNKVVHGFPDSVPLQEGDILSVDFGVVADGFYGDSAVTFAVGQIDEKRQKLLTVTESALMCAIEAAAAGARLSDLSHAVQSHVEPAGFSVVREFVGHGIGRQLHEAPQLPNFGPPGHGPRLKEGMVLAIEPMINAGTAAVSLEPDGWTAITVDGEPSAHFEHTVAITRHGAEILTAL
ncbi:type I methionyl aminopeptidase [Geoalkalibacter subterraneus]|uniref:Methionine aminopeptidase n=1 Tax=Geoalkalibacter subterraneus TaxID=483547 RepID=A0A0B5FIM8_9BACT|nr:type I methionyl aminopeptidase [Geoalkalibacter subterraneus]AJF07218.1 methionine aminopeptidase [Geoalkalibacter subterraneus]